MQLFGSVRSESLLLLHWLVVVVVVVVAVVVVAVFGERETLSNLLSISFAFAPLFFS